MPKSVLQNWVAELGLRHQGVLLTVVRGCDTAPKDDASKLFTRMLRGCFLNCFCGDATKAATFIEAPLHEMGEFELSSAAFFKRFTAFSKNLDHYPHHYVMHVVHAVQIIGYKHPENEIRAACAWMYEKFCHGLHVVPEPETMMDARLLAEEEEFAKNA